MRVPWLAPVLHDAGLPVVPLDGWTGRGRELAAVKGLVVHHTATPKSRRDDSVAHLLRDGRGQPGDDDYLPGPLSQLGLDRQGRYWLIADGRCNHNGPGQWGNDSVGIEAFNDGKGEAWPAVQMDAYVRGTAAILRHLGFDERKVLAHRETDPRRKIDPAGIDMDAFRGRVARLLSAEDDDVKRYPNDAPYKPLTVDLNGKGTLVLPFRLDEVVSVAVVANSDGTLPVVEVHPGAGLDGVTGVLYAEGAPGVVGVVVGYLER